MTVIKLYLILKCSILILKFSHVLHIHNKKGLYLKFSNYHFFFFYGKRLKMGIRPKCRGEKCISAYILLTTHLKAPECVISGTGKSS